MKEVEKRIVSVLRALGVPVSKFELRVKEYSKNNYGVYRVKTNRVYLYLYKDSEGKEKYSFDELMSTAIHESCHAIQWNDPEFTRKRGVMHDSSFWDMYNTLIRKYEMLKESCSEVRDACENTRYDSESSKDSIIGRTTTVYNHVLCVASRRKN